MHVICPHCHKTVDIHLTGRKRKEIDFTTICKAISGARSDKGSWHFIRAAAYIEETTGISVSPAFVKMRVQREAEDAGTTEKKMLAGILSGQVTGEPAKKYQG